MVLGFIGDSIIHLPVSILMFIVWFFGILVKLGLSCYIVSREWLVEIT